MKCVTLSTQKVATISTPVVWSVILSAQKDNYFTMKVKNVWTLDKFQQKLTTMTAKKEMIQKNRCKGSSIQEINAVILNAQILQFRSNAQTRQFLMNAQKYATGKPTYLDVPLEEPFYWIARILITKNINHFFISVFLFAPSKKKSKK